MSRIYTINQYYAYYLANELNDKKHFGFYARLVKKYELSDILFVLGLTKDIIKHSNKPVQKPGALFTKIFFEYVKKLDKLKT